MSRAAKPLVEKSLDFRTPASVSWSMVTDKQVIEDCADAEKVRIAWQHLLWRTDCAAAAPESTVAYWDDLRATIDRAITYLREVRKTL